MPKQQLLIFRLIESPVKNEKPAESSSDIKIAEVKPEEASQYVLCNILSMRLL